MAFQALEVSFELIRSLAPIVEKIKRRDRSLSEQIRRAASSVPLNLAEGSRRKDADRIHFWRIAAGSAREVRAALHTAKGWGYVAEEATATSLALLDRILAMLWRLTDGL